ncbi:DUF6457 domain-containing protein [Dactylosporangium sucinum]|uniref:DUF6457 domain-containing protein n=1 Tax=Dactylosporangium sucinum TaxID=1424081 RepID=A0A917X728_9ACTN|nr:DUF6457 domain-containing protein [Dactylosporangium sucinum]GGM83862.1 hypothetical protein GCM10007977_101590 [Dactylosporangium sucinum]
MSENVLADWLRTAAEALGVDALTIEERDAILDLAKDVAHGVARPAAPLTAFLAGVAVGRGADLQRAREVLGRLATRAEGTIESG